MPRLEVELGEISSRIWKTVLDFSLTPCPDPAVFLEQKDILAGCVQFSGAWQGALVIYCSGGLARRAAAAIFDDPPDRINREHAVDTIIELANMTGGNIKPFLPKPCHLSIPLVILGDRLNFVVPGGQLINQVVFENQGDLVKVLLMQQPGHGDGKPGRIQFQ